MAYTRLPNAHIFRALLNLMDNFKIVYNPRWNVIRYTKEDQLVMTLMKLRCNFRMFDLRVRLGCSVATVSNVTRTWIIALHQILFEQLMKEIPTKEKNNESLPTVFENYPNTRIVIDCTEIACEQPHDRELQKKTV